MLMVSLIGESSEVVFPEVFSGEGWLFVGPRSENLSGWWSLDPRAQAVERPNMNGSYGPMGLLVSHRVVGVQAVFRGSESECEVARSLIASLVSQHLRMVITDGDEVLHAKCFISEKPAIKNLNATTFTLGLVLTCPDPLKYSGTGESLSDWLVASGFWSTGSAGGLLFPLFDQAPNDLVSSTAEPTMRFTESGLTNSVTVINDGQAAVWPILEATGPLSTARWECAGHVVEWEGVLDEGNLLRIDTRSGDVTVGEFEAPSASIISDDFFQIQPGENTVSFSADRNASYRVRWLSAWM